MIFNLYFSSRGIKVHIEASKNKSCSREFGKENTGVRGPRKEVGEGGEGGGTHPLVGGGQQRSNGVTETQEGGPLLRLAVPALHHHLIPARTASLKKQTAAPAVHLLIQP